MKLAIITSRYPTESDPYRHMFVHVRALYFNKKGVDVTILVPSKEKLDYDYQGIKVKCDHSSSLAKELVKFDILYLHLLNIYPGSTGGFSIYNAILKHKYKIVFYIHGTEVLTKSKYYFDSIWTFKELMKWFYNNTWKKIFMGYFLKKITYNNPHAILAPSKWMLKETEIIYNLSFPESSIIPNGIDTQLFKNVSDYENRFKMISIRPLNDKKYAIDECIRLLKILPIEFTLDIYGKGIYLKEYVKLIDELNLNDRIKIHTTFINREKINALFRKYGIFLALTKIDAQGVMMCESMASGLITVSNPNSAIPEFINDLKNGIIGNDSKSIANKILKVVNDETLFNDISINARESMEKINWQATGERELHILNKVFQA